ncbi:MAG: hemolysin family protein [Oscillospiraceae bacterium]
MTITIMNNGFININSDEFKLFLGLLSFIIIFLLIGLYSLKNAFDVISQSKYKEIMEKNNNKTKIFDNIFDNGNVFNINIIISTTIISVIFLYFLDIIFNLNIFNLLIIFSIFKIIIKYLSYYLGLYKIDFIISKFIIVSNFIFLIITPIYLIVNIVMSLFCKIFITNFGEDVEKITEDEIKHMVEESREYGLIEDDKQEMINNVFDFHDIKSSEVMTHRTDIVAIDINENKIDQIIKVAIEGGFSRIPVYKDDIDNITGILYVKDLLSLLIDKEKIFFLKDFVRKPIYAPETNSCKKIFDELCLKRVQMAVLVDEYGGTSGIVTMEDILEFIVGDIEDEYDQDDENEIEQISDNVYIVDGSYNMLDFCIEKGLTLDIDLEKENGNITIAGYISDYIGKVPYDNETIKIEVGNGEIETLDIEENRIKKVKITLKEVKDEYQ